MTAAQFNEYQRQADVIEEANKWKQEENKKESVTEDTSDGYHTFKWRNEKLDI